MNGSAERAVVIVAICASAAACFWAAAYADSHRMDRDKRITELERRVERLEGAK